MFEPRPHTEHPYERPVGHPLSDHDRQSEPGALCEAAAALVCAAAHARDLLDHACAQGAHDLSPVRSGLEAALALCDMLRHVLNESAAPISFCEESWIAEAEISTGMLMADLDQAR